MVALHSCILYHVYKWQPALTCTGREELEGKWPINVDHPFVAVIRDFATDAFNAVAHMVFPHA